MTLQTRPASTLDTVDTLDTVAMADTVADPSPHLVAACVLTAAFTLHVLDGKGFSTHLDVEVTLEDVFLGRTKQVSYIAYDTYGVGRAAGLAVRLVEYHSPDGDTVRVYPGAGDDSPWARAHGVARGDAVVHLRVAPHPHIHVDRILNPYDLHATLVVSLYDYYYGRTFELAHVDGRKLRVPYAPRGRDSTCSSSAAEKQKPNCVILEGEGLPFYRGHAALRGALVVYFDVCLPAIPPADLDNVAHWYVLRKLFVTKYPVRGQEALGVAS